MDQTDKPTRKFLLQKYLRKNPVRPYRFLE